LSCAAMTAADVMSNQSPDCRSLLDTPATKFFLTRVTRIFQVSAFSKFALAAR
jgi:hypothetical protein